MVQIGADTRPSGSGYHYDDTHILGFSHVHKSGGGCGDFLDILFLPLQPGTRTDTIQHLYSQQFRAELSHGNEYAEPGYYNVQLYDRSLSVELTASLRCGIQRYKYDEGDAPPPVVVDLEYGSCDACTIVPEDTFDTVFLSSFRMIDPYTVEGCRLTYGWCPEQHVYFHTTFSSPIKECVLYLDNERCDPAATSVKGTNIKAVITFEDTGRDHLEIKTGISSVDTDGARANHSAEVLDKSFDSLKSEAVQRWTGVLDMVEIETPDSEKKELFYTSLHNTMMYPMLFSDVDNHFRGPDGNVHRTDGFPYYGGSVGTWDVFRAAFPLTSILFPDVASDYVKTMLEFFNHAGQLPVWVLAGMETYQMTGIHSIPMITNAYMNGIDIDTDAAINAMTASAMRDTTGFSMRYFVGLENYKKYGYVPCDLEMESVARTLEYAYDDHAIARLAEQVGRRDIYDRFRERSLNYKNVFDATTLFARGKTADGAWRTPFDPLSSNHRGDDYCEGNAWQWTFFVPHDVDGLAELMGGRNVLASRLDSLFTMSSKLVGGNVSGDISGLIGQYAHGNEPGHHTIYMYNRVGQPKKTQHYVNRVLTTLYENTPEGYCGNEDTGQMSAWYVFSALGFYPMDPVSGQYEIGAPLFPHATINLPLGKQFTIRADNLSGENIYVDKIFLNGKQLDRTYITFDELLQGGELRFEMTDGRN
jgi:predicted alpha-1,2-mannosidase